MDAENTDRKKSLIVGGAFLLGALSLTMYLVRARSTTSAAPPDSASSALPGQEMGGALSNAKALATAGDPGSASPADAPAAGSDDRVPVNPGLDGARSDAGTSRGGARAPSARQGAVAKAATPATSATTAPTAAPAASSRPSSEEAALMIGQFANRVGPQFRLIGVTCLVDGQSVYKGAGGPSMELFRRASQPGSHTVSIIAEYQGNGSGVFSYFDGYHFTVRGSRAFAANTEGPTRIAITGLERGGPTTSFEDRLALNINVK